MKKLALELLGLLIFTFSVIGGLEVYYGKYLTQIDQLFNKIYSSKETTTVIIGNSHLGLFKFGDPERTINLSIGGQDLFHSYLMAREAVNQLPNLDTLIIGIDNEVLGYSLITTNQSNIAREYLIHTDTLDAYNLTNILLGKSAFFRHNRNLDYIINPPEATVVQEINFSPLSTASFEQECITRSRELSSVKFDSMLIDKNIQIISQIKKLAGGQNIALIFINTPKSNCYLKLCNKANIAAAQKAIEQIKQIHRLNHLDYCYSDLFDDNDFQDPDHMNAKGHLKLRALVTKDLKEL